MKQLVLLIVIILFSSTVLAEVRSEHSYVEASKLESKRPGFDEGMLNPVEAYEWLTKETEVRNYTAQTLLALMFKHGVYVEKDTDLALSMLLESSSHGEFMALCLLADAYENGDMGIHRDKDVAKHLNDKLDNNQKVWALLDLADFFNDVNDIENEIKYLLKLTTLSSHFAAPTAICRVGKIYYYGEEVQRNYDKAFDLLKISAEAPNRPSSEAMRLLSACYRHGFGTSQDLDKAEFWLNKAQETGSDDANEILQLLIQKIAEQKISDLDIN